MLTAVKTSNSPHSSSCCEVNLNHYFYLLTATERLYWLQESPGDLNRSRFLQGVENIPGERDPRGYVFQTPYFADEETEVLEKGSALSWVNTRQNGKVPSGPVTDQTSRNNKSEKRKNSSDCSSGQSLSEKNI